LEPGVFEVVNDRKGRDVVTFTKILFPTDFSTSADQAFVWALELAETYGAELHVFHGLVLGGVLDEGAEEELEELESVARELESRASSRIRAIGAGRSAQVRMKRVTRRGISAASLIRDYADEEDVDLTVMGTHGRRGPAHVLLGSVAEEVVRTSMNPVLTIPERATSAPLRAVERVLVPLDLSQHSLLGLEHGKALAESYGARLQLFHVVERMSYPSFYALEEGDLSSLLAGVEERAREELARTMEQIEGSSVPFDTHIAQGEVVPAILDFAKSERSDLIVLTSHGLTGLTRLLLGSVAEKVIRRAKVPVFTVKSFGRPSPSSAPR
jgi:nucleotide-binding universal stress UspA family protein